MKPTCALFALVTLLVAAAPASAQTASHWGGFIGGDETFRQPTPLSLEIANPVVVQASNASGYAADAEGRVFAWGNNARGELGDGTATDSVSPVEVALPSSFKAVTLGEAKNEALAANAAGEVFVWGANAERALCVREFPIMTPVQIPGLSGVVEISGGQERVLFRTKDGHVLACGTNRNGELGLGEDVHQARTPTEVPGLEHVVQISAGASYSAALLADGEIFMWGSNEHSHIGLGSTAPIIWKPTHVVLPEPAREVYAGGDLSNGGTLAVGVSGKVYGWGDDEHGTLGNGRSEREVKRPEYVGLSGYKYVATGGAESFGLTSSGVLESWGGAALGALGVSDDDEGHLAPEVVQTGVSSVSATAGTVVSLSE